MHHLQYRLACKGTVAPRHRVIACHPHAHHHALYVSVSQILEGRIFPLVSHYHLF